MSIFATRVVSGEIHTSRRAKICHIFKWGKRREKHSVIAIAAIVGYQLTRLLPCLCVLTRLSKSRDPRPRNKSQLIPLSYRVGNKVRHSLLRHCGGFTAASLFTLNPGVTRSTEVFQVFMAGDLGSAEAEICYSSGLREHAGWFSNQYVEP